jgi:N-acylneuraminate cytidylyltransferase
MNASELSSRRCVAVIPARGGSKRIPHKNIRPFAGRPLIEYAIGLAQECGLFERIIVSTDSSEICEAAEKAGAEVPFMRPAMFSDDHVTSAAVIHHALEAIAAEDQYEYVCCLYPATPFTNSDDLQRGLALLIDGDAKSTFAVTRFAAPIRRAFEQRQDKTLALVWPEYRDTRSQDLRETYHDIGQFYWLPVQSFMQDQVLISEQSRGVVYERWRAHDIDTEEDWMLAETIFRSISKDRQ